MNDDEPHKLSTIIGKRLREARDRAGVRQEDVAAMATRLGIQWGRSSVAMLEAGKRNLSAEELILLPYICRLSGIDPEPFIQGSDRIQLSPENWFHGKHVQVMLRGITTPETIADLPNYSNIGLQWNDDEVPDTVDTLAHDDQWHLVLNLLFTATKVWPHFSETLVILGPEIPFTYLNQPSAFDKKITKAITRPDAQTDPTLLIILTCFALYGWPGELERDERAKAKGPYQNERGLQTAKGHATREIREEVRAELIDKMPKFNEQSKLIVNKELGGPDFRSWVGWMARQWWDTYDDFAKSRDAEDGK